MKHTFFKTLALIVFLFVMLGVPYLMDNWYSVSWMWIPAGLAYVMILNHADE